MKMFTVYDNKAKYYLKPFVVENRGEALRQFIDVCNDPQHAFYKWAEDFTLLEIGDWDSAAGQVVPYQKTEPIARAWELKHAFTTDHMEEGEPNGWFGEGKSGVGEHPEAKEKK